MEYLLQISQIFWVVIVFLLGTGVGSFLNVLIARLPYEKSIIWPSSRCFSCFKPIGLFDNLPMIGYMRLRGKCRNCQAPFSSRYLWVEILTGLAFVGLYVLEILENHHNIPGLVTAKYGFGAGNPSIDGIFYFAIHALLLAGLIASSVIDLQHRIIPPQITYTLTLVGIIASTVFAWPWPTDPASLTLPTDPWILFEFHGKIPSGLALWPFWGPLPTWAPLGSWQLGLMNGICGAAVGMMIGRGIKLVFELGMGKEALGLGDADLLMMAGAFLGWQAITLALPVGAVLTLMVVFPWLLYNKVRRRNVQPQIPFGPGIAAGIIFCWFFWPKLSLLVQAVFFDLFILGFVVLVMGGGMLISGLFLRRKA